MRLNLIDYVVANTDYNQTQLAQHLGVPPGDVRKWKQNSLSIPEGQRKALFDLVGLFGDELEWAMLTKTEENARAWVAYMSGMDGEGVLQEVMGGAIEDTCYVLTLFQEYGVDIPELAPEVPLDEDYAHDRNSRYSFSRLVLSFLYNMADVNSWMNAVAPYDADELADVWVDLRVRAGEVALRFIDDEELLIENGVDVARKQAQDKEAKVSLRLGIEELCEGIVSRNVPIYHDYYQLVRAVVAEDLLDAVMLRSVGDSVENHLPWGERVQIDLLRSNLEMTARLLRKIEALAGKDGE